MNLQFASDAKRKCETCPRIVYGAKFCIPCKTLKKKNAQAERYAKAKAEKEARKNEV